MLKALWNRLLLRNLRMKRVARRLIRSLQSELADDLLEMLLKLMRLVFLIDRDFRRNIDGFEGRYVFRTRSGGLFKAVLFRKSRMELRDAEPGVPDIEISFRDQKSLASFLFSPKPDILDSLLKQNVTICGNLNFLYKFAYMANHLRLMAMRWA